MANELTMAKEREALVEAAKHLENAAYGLAGYVETSTVSRLILLSHEITGIEERLCRNCGSAH